MDYSIIVLAHSKSTCLSIWPGQSCDGIRECYVLFLFVYVRNFILLYFEDFLNSHKVCIYQFFLKKAFFIILWQKGRIFMCNEIFFFKVSHMIEGLYLSSWLSVFAI